MGVELHEREVGDAVEDAADREQSGAAAALGEVDLGDVAGDDDLGAEPEPGEEHLHLLGRGVLRLVEDDERVVERAPRMNASGATSIVPRSISRGTASGSSMSYSAS